MKPESQDFLAKAKRSLNAARLLDLDGHSEFAAARAYYSMFYVAEALLRDVGLEFSSHSATIGAYGKEFSKTGKLKPEFHRWLMDAQDFRLKADYDPIESIKQVEANLACQWAEEFIEAAEQYLKSESPDHERRVGGPDFIA